MQKPRRYRGRAQEHAGISREKESEKCRAGNEQPGEEPKELVDASNESQMGVQFEGDQAGNGAGTEHYQDPNPHRHRGTKLEHSQHVEEKPGPAKVENQQDGRDNCREDSKRHRRGRDIWMVKRNCGQRDHSRHATKPANEKINWDFPNPHRRFYDRLSVITSFARNWPAHDIYSAVGDDTFFPSLFAQLFKPLLGSWITGLSHLVRRRKERRRMRPQPLRTR